VAGRRAARPCRRPRGIRPCCPAPSWSPVRAMGDTRPRRRGSPEEDLDWVRCARREPLIFLLALNLFLIVVGCLADIFPPIVFVAPLVVRSGRLRRPTRAPRRDLPRQPGELGYLTAGRSDMIDLFLVSRRRFGRAPCFQVFRDTWPFSSFRGSGSWCHLRPAISIGVLSAHGTMRGARERVPRSGVTSWRRKVADLPEEHFLRRGRGAAPRAGALASSRIVSSER